jgi:hypothetical protein
MIVRPGFMHPICIPGVFAEYNKKDLGHWFDGIGQTPSTFQLIMVWLDLGSGVQDKTSKSGDHGRLALSSSRTLSNRSLTFRRSTVADLINIDTSSFNTSSSSFSDL